MENIKVKNVIIAKQKENSKYLEKLLKIAGEKNINLIIAKKGDKINIEKNLYFNILWPNENEFITENALNNNALVCKLYYKNFSCIFTGDIEEIAEKEIISLYKKTNLLKSTVLKVAHHGSKTSSTQEFLELVNPKIALIGVKKKNTYGHPDLNVLTRLKNLRNLCI